MTARPDHAVTRLLLDTSVLIEVIRNPASPQGERMAALGDDVELLLSSLVAAELAEGFALLPRQSRAQERYERLASVFTQSQFDFDAAAAYGPLRASLRKRGSSIGAIDELIAAHALANDATVATLNVADFSRVAGLRVADWSSPKT